MEPSPDSVCAGHAQGLHRRERLDDHILPADVAVHGQNESRTGRVQDHAVSRLRSRVPSEQTRK